MDSIESSRTQDFHDNPCLENNSKIPNDGKSAKNESESTQESSFTINSNDKEISPQKKQNIFSKICIKAMGFFKKDKECFYECVMCKKMFPKNKIIKNPCKCISCKSCGLYERREYWWMIGCVIKDKCRICGLEIIVEER